MKYAEWLLPVVLPLFDKKEDAELFVSASAFKDIDVPDDFATKFGAKYLTRDRAKTDPQIIEDLNKGARARVWATVDDTIKKILPKLNAQDQEMIEGETQTLKKIELLGPAMENLSKNEDVKKVSEAARKREEALHTQIKDFEKTIKEKDATFDRQIKDTKLDYALKNKVLQFDLAPEFASDKHKNFLADSTISSLKKTFVLEFDEKDQSLIHLRKNVDGALVDHYDESNTKLTLDDVLKKEYEPYIKKSTGTGDGSQGKQKQEVKIPTDKSTNGKTLREMQREAAV